MGGGIFGGLTPMVVTLMLKANPMGPAWYVAGLCVLGMVIGVYLLRSKSNGQ
jgi:hypothetical protein